MTNLLRHALFGFACVSALTRLPVSAATLDTKLQALWESDNIWDSGPSGQLVLTGSSESWHAVLNGNQANFRAKGHGIEFEFPNHRGTFRGQFEAKNVAISGFWIAPHGQPGDPHDPDGRGMRFASPVRLIRTEDGSWRGTVEALPNTITVYLKIFRDSKGALTAAVRNPEVNFHGGSPQLGVTLSGNTVVFSPDAAHPGKPATAHYSEANDSLEIQWPQLAHVFAFHRADPAQARGFFLRLPNAPPYSYRVPKRTDDGWAVARAREVGLDEARLAHVVGEIAAADPAAKFPNLIHSLLVARHGKLVLDEYFGGFDADRPHDLRSASKTYSSVLLGTLMHAGIGISPSTRLYSLLAAMGSVANPDPRKQQITLAEVMTHTTGLACDDADDKSPGNEETLQSQRNNPDWWKYVLDLPVVHEPGSVYAYASACMNLMGAALTTAARTPMPELFDRNIARPLQFGRYYWDIMPNGEGYLGGGAYVRPRDFLKLGQLYLNGGVWNGVRVADAAWVAQSTAPRVPVTPASTRLTAAEFANNYVPGVDGYAWHLTVLHAPAHDYRAYCAGGNGGQLLIVIPDLDMTVAFTGGNYGQGLIWNKWRDELLPHEIIPAVMH